MKQILLQHSVLFYSKIKPLWQQCAVLHRALKPAAWLYISDEHKEETITQSFAKHEIDSANGEILLSKDFFYRQPVFRIPPIIKTIKEKAQIVNEKGGGAILFFIEMTWTVRTPSAAIYLREYESAIHQLTEDLDISICCLYNESVLLDDHLMTALQTHPSIITMDGIKENPYFLPPAIFAKRNQRHQFKYWLQKIDPSIADSAFNIKEKNEIEVPVNSNEISVPIYNIDSPSILITAEGKQGRWKIRCLGELKIYRENGDTLDWNTKGGSTRKIKTIFAYLLYKGERGASIEELVDILWADILDIKQGANRLYHSIRYLRKILSPELTIQTQSPYVLNRDNKYFLAVPTDTWIDLPMFQELCFKGNKQLKEGDLKNALISYQSAERLYKGDLLSGIPSKYIDNLEHDWCWSRRYWFRDMNLKLLYETAFIHRKLGNIVEALNYCDKALRIEPCSEMAHQEKMKTFFAAKRMDALNRQYRLYCKALKQFDMGEASKEMKTLYKELT